MVLQKTVVIKGMKAFLTFSLILVNTQFLVAFPLSQPSEAWTLDLPSGIDPIDAVREKHFTAFADPSGELSLQIFVINKSNNPEKEAQAIFRGLQAQEGPSGHKNFTWNSRNCFLIEMQWLPQGGKVAQGYLLAVGREKDCLLLLVATPETSFETDDPIMESMLDSLSLDPSDQTSPGPISGGYYKGLDQAEIDQAFMERELEILEAYGEATPQVQFEAIARVLRLQYRQSFSQFSEIASAIRLDLIKNKIPLEGHAQKLANIIQGFSFEKAGVGDDFKNPINTWKDKKGDLDSRAICYAIILKYWGISSIMMLNHKTGTTMVGIDAKGNGARYSLHNVQYLVCDLANPVPLGQIDKAKSNTNDWLGFEFEPQPLEIK